MPLLVTVQHRSLGASYTGVRGHLTGHESREGGPWGPRRLASTSRALQGYTRMLLAAGRGCTVWGQWWEEACVSSGHPGVQHLSPALGPRRGSGRGRQALLSSTASPGVPQSLSPTVPPRPATASVAGSRVGAAGSSMGSRLSPGPSGSCIQTCLKSAYLLVKSCPSKAEMQSGEQGALAAPRALSWAGSLSLCPLSLRLGWAVTRRTRSQLLERGGVGMGRETLVVACRVCTLHIHDLDWSS